MKHPFSRTTLLLLGLGLFLAGGGFLALYNQLAPPPHFTLAETVKIIANKTPPKEQFFISGFIERGSMSTNGDDHFFRLTDMKNALTVHYWGLPPDNYQEAHAIVVLGTPTAEGIFEATHLFTKMDKRYLQHSSFTTLLEPE